MEEKSETVSVPLLHTLSLQIVRFSANFILKKNISLYDRKTNNPRQSMYDQWLGDMSYFPEGSLQQFNFALQTLCASVKLNMFCERIPKSHPAAPEQQILGKVTD